MAKKKSRAKISKSKRRKISRSNKKRNQRQSDSVAYEPLEPRQLLAVTTLPFISSGQFNQFTGGDLVLAGTDGGQGFGIRGVDGVATEPRFLGFSFNENADVGGFEEGFFNDTFWGAQVDATAAGRFGIEYGYFVSEGLGSIVSEGDFQYEVLPTANDSFRLTTSTLVDDSRLQTVSPTISAYVDLIVELDASIDGAACAGVFGCAGGQFDLDVNRDFELLSLNRQLDGSAGVVNGVPVFDGDFRLLDIGLGDDDDEDLVSEAENASRDLTSAINAEDRALHDLQNAKNDTERQTARDNLQSARKSKADATAAGERVLDKIAKDSKVDKDDDAGFGLSIGPADGGLLGVKATLAPEVQVGVFGASKEFGSLSLTLPEVNLSDSATGTGTLFASTQDDSFDKDKSDIARLELNVGTLLSQYIPFLGTTNVSVGPVEASLTTVEYTLGATLDVTQDIEAVFEREIVTVTFGTQVIVADGTTLLDEEGEPRGPGSFTSNVLRFERGTPIDFKPVDSNAGNVTADFQLDREYTVANDIGLGFGLDGELSALAASLEVAFGPLDFTLFDIGPLFSNSHQLATTSLPAFSFDEYTATSVAEFGDVLLNLGPDVTAVVENQSSVIVDDLGFDSHREFSFDAVITNEGLADATNVGLNLSDLNLADIGDPSGLDLSASSGTLTISNSNTATLTGLGTLEPGESITVTFTGRTSLAGSNTALYSANIDVTSDSDADPNNNSAETSIPVRQTKRFFVSSGADVAFRTGSIDANPDFCASTSNLCNLREAVYSAQSTGLLSPAVIQIEVPLVEVTSNIFTENSFTANRFHIVGMGPENTRIASPAGNDGLAVLGFLAGAGPEPYLIRGVTFAGEVGGSTSASTSQDALIVAVATDLVLDDVVVEGHNNRALRVEFASNITIKNSTLRSNSTPESGGAIELNTSTLLIEDSELVNNSASISGGAIIVDGLANLTIVDTLIADNQAPLGAAVLLELSDDVLFERVTVTNNTATDAAGGIIEAGADGGLITAEQLVIYENDGDNFVNTHASGGWANRASALGANFIEEDFTSPTTRNIGLYDDSTGGGITYEFTYTAPDLNQVSVALLGTSVNSGNPDFDTAALKLEQFNNSGKYGVTKFGEVDFVSTVDQIADERTHVVFVSDGTDMLLYVNGTLVDTIAGASVNISGIAGIGRTLNSGLPSDVMSQGTIHGFAVYDRALSADEIASSAIAGLADADKNSQLNVSDDTSIDFGVQAANGFQSENVDSLVRFQLPDRLARIAGSDISQQAVFLADTPGAEVSEVFWTLPGRELASSTPVELQGLTDHPQFEIVDGVLKLKAGVSLAPDTIVELNILGIDTEGNSFVDSVFVKAIAAPTLPTGVGAEVFVGFQIESSDDNESNETGAFIERTFDQFGDFGNVEWDLVADTEYIVRAFAVDANGISDGSDDRVQVIEANTLTTGAAGFVNLHTDTLYKFSVEARNLAGATDAVNSGVIRTHKPAPSQVKISSAIENPADNSITVQWSESQNADGYRVFVNGETVNNFFFDDRGVSCNEGDEGCVVAVTNQRGNTSFTLQNTSPDTVYEFEIEAVNAATIDLFEGQPATVPLGQIARVVVESDMLVPTKPTNVTARGIAPTRAILEWDSTLHTSEYQIVGRIVGETDFQPFFIDQSQIDDDTVVKDYVPIAGGTTRKVVDGLTPGKNYEFRVIATNEDNETLSDIVGAQTNFETQGLLVTTTDDVVDSSDFQTSLREAINFANATADADGDGLNHDRIRFDIDGAFSTPQTVLLSRELVISEDLTIAGDEGVSLSGQDQNRIFFVDGNRIDLTLQDLVLQNGRSSINGFLLPKSISFEGQGGAVFFKSDGVLTLVDSTITNSDATALTTASNNVSGGAIHSTGAVHLVRTAIVGNNAIGNNPQGGGIYSAKTIDVNGSFIDDNFVDATGFTSQPGFVGAKGGGLSAAGRINLVESTVSNNTISSNAIGGGGIYGSGAVTLVRSVVDQNETTGLNSAGGGILASGVSTNRSTISNNLTLGQNAQGGGISTSGNAVLTTTTIAGNSARGASTNAPTQGGGVAATQVFIDSSTITGNATDGDGGGIHTLYATLSNSIILGNHATNGANEIEVSNSTTLTDNNIIGGANVDDVFADTQPFYGGRTGLLGNNGAMGTIGGPTNTIVQTVALKLDPANPALDLNSSSTVQFDARGKERAVDFPGVSNGGSIDAGAFEVEDQLIVDSLVDSADLPGFLTLREAINLANNLDDFDEITFADHLSGQVIALDGELPVITQGVEIDGSDLEERIIIDAGFQSRHLTFDGTGGLALDSLVLRNGFVEGDNANASDSTFSGGSIRFESSTSDEDSALFLTNTAVTDSATLGLGAAGGAIFAEFDAVVLTNSQLTNNSTNGRYSAGGAVFADSVFFFESNSVRLNKTTGDDSPGGAIFATDSFYAGQTTVTSYQGTSFRDNYTSGHNSPGGAVHLRKASIGQALFASNNTRGDGSGGGALVITQGATILETNFESNGTAGDDSPGGAINHLRSDSFDFEVAASSFIGNSTQGSNSSGGAIFAEREAFDAEAITVMGNSTSGINSPGGGISVSYSGTTFAGTVYIQQGTITGNSTAQNGSPGGGIAAGGIYARFSTITGNSTNSQSPNLSPGGGVAVDVAQLVNSLILGNYSHNSNSNDLQINDGTLFLGGLSLVGSDPNDFAPTAGSYAGFGYAANANPEDVFASIAPVNFDSNQDGNPDSPALAGILSGLASDNGGRRLTIALNPDLTVNASLDSGEDGGLEADVYDLDNDGDTTEPIPLDANGAVRVVGLGASGSIQSRSEDGDNVDLGATELPGLAAEEKSLVVTTLDDSEYEFDQQTSLREAIAFANSGDADGIDGDLDRITFDPSLAGQTIQLDGTELTITESLIIDATNIGGVTIDAMERSRSVHFDAPSGNLSLNGLTLTSGRTTEAGGGIRFDSNGILTLNSSRVTDNQTRAFEAGGGGIYAVGDVVLNNSLLDNNRTLRGTSPGGAVQTLGSATIFNSTLSSNETLSSNSSGGAVSANRLNVTNATVVKNTVSGNQSTGGGLHAEIGSTIRNSIVLDNRSDFDLASSELNRDAFLGFENGNIIGESSGTFDTDGTSAINAEFSKVFESRELSDNGGTLPTFALLPSTTNPALDAGRLANETLAVDVRGLPRSIDLPGINGDATVDLGAYELQTGTRELPSLLVTTDSDDVDPFDFATSLREAVAFANDTAAGSQNDGDADEDGFIHDTITFSESLRDKSIVLDGSELLVTASATIAGLGADQLTISGDDRSRIFNFSSNAESYFNISDVTLTNGAVPRGSDANPDVGGAIRLNNNKLVIERSVIAESKANGGGAIFVGGNGTELEITDSALINNEANFSGAALLTFGNVSSSIVNSTISGNNSLSNSSAIMQQTVGSDVATMDLRNVTIADNTGVGVFNAVATAASTITFGNSIIADNSGGALAGGGTFTSLGHNLTDDGSPFLTGTNDMNSVDPLLKPLALNGGSTPTHALDFASLAIDRGLDSNAFDAEGNALVSDQSGSSRVKSLAVDIGAFEFTAEVIPPTVETIVINGGETQRSLIQEITVTFDEVVNVDSSSFIVKNTNTGVCFVAEVETQIVNNQTIAILTFSGSGIINGSLPDGNYELEILDTITDAAGNQLDGDGNGIAGGNARDDFFRLYGDATGDGRVNVLDLLQFRNAFNSADGDSNFNAALDAGGDGRINVLDLLQFRNRFNTTV